MTTIRIAAVRLATVAVLGGATFVGGCSTLGAAAGVVASALPLTVDAAYTGLANKTVGVMVWTDRAIHMDQPELQFDIAATLQTKLIGVQKSDSPDALKGATFPFMTQEIIRYQEDHPEIESVPIATTAAKLRLDRLIYVEVTDFATKSAESEVLYRGSIKATIRVLEITDSGARQGYSKDDVSVIFPKDTPNEGLPIGTDASVSQGVVDAFTTKVAKLFYKHEEERP